jgi:hypothetical protein
MEVMKWFDLGTSLELVEMTFNYTWQSHSH